MIDSGSEAFTGFWRKHLEVHEAALASRNCFEVLASGGFLRCAVPDRVLPNDDYQNLIQIGVPGSVGHPAATHRIVCDYQSLSQVFALAGFDVRLLEWWDERGDFHADPWDERDGFVCRSKRFDLRNLRGTLVFTSLILDAVKPG